MWFGVGTFGNSTFLNYKCEFCGKLNWNNSVSALVYKTCFGKISDSISVGVCNWKGLHNLKRIEDHDNGKSNIFYLS
jgi:hypothetical protein